MVIVLGEGEATSTRYLMLVSRANLAIAADVVRAL